MNIVNSWEREPTSGYNISFHKWNYFRFRNNMGPSVSRKHSIVSSQCWSIHGTGGGSIAILFQFCVAISIFNFISCRESCRVPWQLPRPHLYPCSKEKHPLNYINTILEIVLLPYPCLCKQLKWLNPRIIWELLDHSLEISHFDNEHKEDYFQITESHWLCLPFAEECSYPI